MARRKAKATVAAPVHPPLPPQFCAGAAMKLVANDARADVKAFSVQLRSFDPRGAWFASAEGLPVCDGVFLIVFEGRETITFYCQVLERIDTALLVAPPWKTLREESQLTHFTGRTDYRVETRYPTELQRIDQPRETPVFCHLCDVSQGGMGIELSGPADYNSGQSLNVRLVSWDYPVRLQANVGRCWESEGVWRLALVFPDDLSELNRDLVTQLIIDVQRRRALQSHSQET